MSRVLLTGKHQSKISLRFGRNVLEAFERKSRLQACSFNTCTSHQSRKKDKRTQRDGDNSGGQTGPLQSNKDPLSVFKPILVRPNPDDLNFGEEIAGKINKQALLKELNRFYTSPEIKMLCKEHGLDEYLYNQAYSSFRRFCMNVDLLPTELYILFSDILAGANHNHDIFPYFLN